MSYVIMNGGTEQLHRKPGHYSPASYDSERGAKIACSKLNTLYSPNGDFRGPPQWVVLTRAEFSELHDPLVTVFNLMTGKPVQIRKSEKGGCTDPSTERYHSM